ncbi:MAG: SecD/SecF fusion protein [Saprospiraceae bacterium]|jgi:SecD/SecF fusion protein
MQGKGIVRFFLIMMILVCLVQYLFILPTNSVEAAAEKHATEEASKVPDEDKSLTKKAAYSAYLDGMSNETVMSIPLLKDYTYQELKAQQLALGLDLKGGMSVVLQVDLREFLEKLTNDPEYEPFKNTLDLADKNLESANSDYITLFADAWQTEGKGQPMRDLFRRNEALKDDINTSTGDGEITRLLREKANETVNLTFAMLKQRIDKLGVVQPNISLDEGRDLILVELPGVENPERAREFLTGAAKLEFWNVYRTSDNNFMQYIAAANDRLKRTNPTATDENRQMISTSPALDSLGNETGALDTLYADQVGLDGPLFAKLTPNTGAFAPSVIGMAKKGDRDAVMAMLTQSDVAATFPKDVKWVWSRDPNSIEVDGKKKDGSEYELYALKMDRGKRVAPLTGEHVVSATAGPNPNGQMEVSLRMDQSGARTWGRMTTKAAQDGNRSIAIVLDDEVVSAPRVNGPITGGSSSISGDFSVEESQDLAQFLEVGRLPATPEIIQESIVGPSLGAANIKSSILSLVGGFALVLLFMLFYYGTAGIVSIACLFLNLFFIFGALASMGAVLTLPGLAGIVLTIGMAVDANVIIYERIREELREGKALRAAVNDGFQNSYSAIIDANVTTFVTAAILAYFGLGPIKGFAVVLMVGVVASVFTAVLVGRLLIDWWLEKGNNLTFWTGASKNAFANLSYDWLGKRKVAYMISSAIIIAGIASMAVRGFDLGVDFKGGYSYNVEFATDVDAEQIREAMTAPFGGVPTVKEVSTANTFNIVTDFNIKDTEKGASDKVMAALFEGIKVLDPSVKLAQFSAPDSDDITHVTSSSKVGPTIADDIRTSAFKAGIFALLFIFLYLFLRFNRWQYSAGAVAALFHDTLIVLGIFSIFHGILPFAMEIDQAFIAAILTVIGYSINDTVVVFDRIREYLNLYTGESKEIVINRAINSTLSRTVITSITTLFVVAILFVFGGGSIKGMAFALLVGVLVGTYSSIFVATPIMSDLSDNELAVTDTKKKSKSSFGRQTSVEP